MSNIKGSMYGSAFGDAYGYITEFSDYEEIQLLQPEVPQILRISDDTQMSIYTIQALEEILNTVDLSDLTTNELAKNHCRVSFADHYETFYHDIDNNRAPGMTCMSALRIYSQSSKTTGLEGSSKNDSKGCGTIMRAPWIGLLGNLSREEIFVLSTLQSQTTHGHPVSWLSSSVLSVLIHDIINNKIEGYDETRLIKHSMNILNDHTETWTKLGYNLKTITEMMSVFAKILSTYKIFKNFDEDVTQFYGEGWIADEALYTSLATSSLYMDNSFEGVKRLVYTSGDSDSIASIGGAILGALNGYNSFNVDIENKLEPRYQKEIKDCFNFINSTH